MTNGKIKNNKKNNTGFDWHCCSLKETLKISIIFLVLVLVLFVGVKTVSEIKDISKPSLDVPTIAISGEGKVFIKPDIGTVTLSVVEEALTVGVAQQSAAQIINRTIAVIKDLGVEEKDIKTTNFSIRPIYQYPKGAREFVAYQVSQSIEVKIRDLDKVGQVLERASSAGVKEIGSISFTVDDPKAIQDEARAKAIMDAKVKAQKLAVELGVELGEIVSFYESFYPIPVPYYGALEAKGMGGGAATPEIPVGENEVRSNITITFELE